jgi:hypothetical protein
MELTEELNLINGTKNDAKIKADMLLSKIEELRKKKDQLIDYLVQITNEVKENENLTLELQKQLNNEYSIIGNCEYSFISRQITNVMDTNIKISERLMKLEYKDDLYRNQTFTSGEIGELE